MSLEVAFEFEYEMNGCSDYEMLGPKWKEGVLGLSLDNAGRESRRGYRV